MESVATETNSERAILQAKMHGGFYRRLLRSEGQACH